ncbi:flagellar filament capping protein FliD [Parazoarcus communis]|uniref:Flagellar hook-associated protein 2 n=1 Tax=Parazoarcus communis SWub3 = DSM 12120 TaxID=1121029 RepID=A0A323UWU2_9RHOO|nr:flagellar filament capping protein FliD [Parazoarcus communis]NMG69068.1 flagellar filament capping protein FliD [Parazoarcus communis SWub3 = DSM 12120]PZA16925.1 flagellar hook protein FliD [Azoarcus communis] [Parazoarcus communis SWub3 = DSM 12120]
MSIDTEYARYMAQQLASYDIAPMQTRISRSQSNYKARLDAVAKLESALRTFRDAMRDIKGGTTGSMVVNKASFSSEGYATATVGSKAVAGNYQFFVEQLASAHQVAISGIQDGDVSAQGSLDLMVGSEGFSVSLSDADTDGDGTLSLAELASAINGATANTGVRATLVRSNGNVSLVLTSEKTGADHAIGVATSGTNPADTVFHDALANRQQLSEARDAKVRLGGEGGMLLTNSGNTFDELIDGVTLTFTRAHAAGDSPLSLEVGQDNTAMQDKARKFVSAVNALLSSVASLTASGGETTSRGALAGDAGTRAIQSQVNRILRETFAGQRLTDFGVTAGRNGLLTLDTAAFEKAVASNPEGLDKLFASKGGMLESLDKTVQIYTSSTNGVLANRKESLNAQLKRLDQQSTQLDQQYERYYTRYLRQYTSMMQIMASMEQTQGMF